MEDISCGEGTRRTLDRFNLTLYSGTVSGVYSHHAQVNADLVGLITARIDSCEGRLYLGQNPRCFELSDGEAHRMVSVVHSVRSMVESLTVSENIFVIRRGFKGLLHSAMLYRQTQKLMETYQLNVKPNALVGQLSSAQRCCLEIVKGVALGAQLIILQDLTNFLSDYEIQEVMALVARIKCDGKGFLLVDSSVIYLGTYAEAVTVIKGGKNLWTFEGHDFNAEALDKCFSSSGMEPDVSEAVYSTDMQKNREVLSFRDVTSGAIKNLNFALCAGEVLCLLDQEGKRIEEIREILSGEKKVTRGSVRIGRHLFSSGSPWESLEQSIALVSENPGETMLFPDLSALENLCFPSGRKTRNFWLNPAYMKSCYEEYRTHFSEDGLRRYPDGLTAQDRLKLAYFRWHLYCPSVVVCFKPFNTIDKSLEDIARTAIVMLQRKGIAVLILATNETAAGIPYRKIVISAKE